MSILDTNLNKETDDVGQSLEQFESATNVIYDHLNGGNVFNMFDFTHSIFHKERPTRWMTFRIGFKGGSVRCGYSKEYSSKMSRQEIKQDLIDHWDRELRMYGNKANGAVTIFVTKV